MPREQRLAFFEWLFVGMVVSIGCNGDGDGGPNDRLLLGRVLSGTALENQIEIDRPSPYTPSHPRAPHYPAAWRPELEPIWDGLEEIAPERRVFAANADACFNCEDAAYRIMFHLSHYGGMPSSAGDFNGDGVEDFINMSHFAYVDGMRFAGEVHIWFGKRDARIDPRTEVPDVIFYGDQPEAKLGISVASAGDFNGDGRDDIVMSACFYDVPAGRGVHYDGGRVYVIYGAGLDLSQSPTKVRIESVGTSVPGLIFEGGHDGSRFVGWANGLEAGDFDGDGVSDLVIGAYNYHREEAGTEVDFDARGYLVYGRQGTPSSSRPYRLGIDHGRDGLESVTFRVPDREWTRSSLGFGAFFVTDLDGDGRDELAFTTASGGESRKGAAWIFAGRAERLSGERTLAEADLVIETTGDLVERDGIALRFEGLAAVRPAGDVDGDGLADALLPARGTKRRIGDEWVAVGAVGILRGSRDLFADRHRRFEDAATILLGGRAGWIGHPAMDRGGDIDGDGFADILVNDPYYLETIGGVGEPQFRGRLWLVRGGPDLPASIDVHRDAALVFLPDTRVPGMFGYTWTTGDWNADGRLDVVIGDHYAGNSHRHQHAGVTYLFYNGSAFTFEPTERPSSSPQPRE